MTDMKLRRLMRLVMVGLALILIGFGEHALAQTLGVDWKYFGNSAEGNDYSLCFYDAGGVTQTPDNQVKVWTKCLSKKSVDQIDIQNDYDGKIVEAAGKKFAESYVPPYSAVEEVSKNEAITITVWEEAADIANLTPEDQIFYELNCSERMLRELSIVAQGSLNDQAGDWMYVPPESNGAFLLKILCSLK